MPRTVLTAESEEKRSRFLAEITPISCTEELKLRISDLWQQHPKASHIVWAFRLSDQAGFISEGFSDDGEPSGTAGMPVLKQLQHTGAINCGVTVIRYFGGTKLGTGGLQRAYSQAVKQLSDTQNEGHQWAPFRRQNKARVVCDFADEANIRRKLVNLGTVIIDINYIAEGAIIFIEAEEPVLAELAESLPFADLQRL